MNALIALSVFQSSVSITDSNPRNLYTLFRESFQKHSYQYQASSG